MDTYDAEHVLPFLVGIIISFPILRVPIQICIYIYYINQPVDWNYGSSCFCVAHFVQSSESDEFLQSKSPT